MRRLVWTDLDGGGRREALARPARREDAALQAKVTSIIEEVRTRGWEGLCEIAFAIDGEEPREVEVAPIAANARNRLPREQVEAIEFAAGRINAFHDASRPADFSMETAPGLTVTKTWRPIDRVGLYVPGGKTPLFSSLLMLAIPAKSAGAREITVVTPPRPEGGLDELVALAAQLAGIDRVWTVGGAHAVAALAFGAGAMPQVDKICGPGNAWVAEAKRQVASMPGGLAIDMPAGPSELLIVADDGAEPTLVAADLLSQAEHDADAQVLLVTTSAKLAGAVEVAIADQLSSLPRRDIAAASLANARIILVANLDEAVEVANAYAPEHLSLAADGWEGLLPAVRNAGAVFAGPLAAETFGDYLAGSSHVLPTDGAARAWGGVSVYTFLKAMSVQTVTPEAARQIARPAAVLARLEALEAHARAADARLEVLA